MSGKYNTWGIAIGDGTVVGQYIEYHDGSTIIYNENGIVTGWVNKGCLKIRKKK